MINGTKLVLSALVALFLVEIILLEQKYQIISGDGFLQSSPLDGILDRLLFFIITLSAYLLFFGIISITVSKLLTKAGISSHKAAFSANSLFLLLYGTTMMVNFKLHQYLANHVDKAVINAIAGDSIKTALAYASNEIVLFALPLLGFIALFIFLVRYLAETPSPIKKIFSTTMVSAGLSVIALIAVTPATNKALHVNSSRATSVSWIQQIAHWSTDFDGDGSSLFSIPQDPAPFNQNIHWGALDVPNNGVDENGLGGDLPALQIGLQITEQFGLNKKYKHLIVIVAESARAEILTKMIDDKPVAPNLRELAASGSNVNQAFSHAGYTANSLYTLFSGRYKYKPLHRSIFEIASDNDFNISVFSGQDERWGDLDKRLKTRELASFLYDPQVEPEKRVFPSKLPSSIKLSDATVVEAFKKQSVILDWETPQFMYFNFQAAHFPYFHENMTRTFISEGIPRSQINKDNTEWLQRTYWNALNYMDQNIGDLIARLKFLDVWDETLLVFLGDHGESLFDDGFLGHGHNINRPQLQIPLILSAPNIEFERPIGLIDVSRWLSNFINGKPKPFEKLGDCTFMYTGLLHAPAQIGRICNDQGLESYTVAFDRLTLDGKISKNEKNRLVHYWENILIEQSH